MSQLEPIIAAVESWGRNHCRLIERLTASSDFASWHFVRDGIHEGGIEYIESPEISTHTPCLSIALYVLTFGQGTDLTADALLTVNDSFTQCSLVKKDFDDAVYLQAKIPAAEVTEARIQEVYNDLLDQKSKVLEQ